MYEKLSQNSERLRICAADEAAALLRDLAEPRPVGDSVKSALRRAARTVGISSSRVKSIWYREARRIDASEMDAIREAAQRRREQVGKLVSIAAAVESSDLDRESIARFVDMLRKLGARDNP